MVSGVTTVIQSARIGRIGSGYLLLMGSSSAFLAICVAALERGGGGLMASLIIVSALCQFILAAKLSLFRKIFTPTVAGTVLMLIPVTLAPIIFRKLNDVPADAAPLAAPVTAGLTLAVMAAISLRASGAWRLWGRSPGDLLAVRSAASATGSTTPHVSWRLTGSGGRSLPGRASTSASVPTSGPFCPPSCW